MFKKFQPKNEQDWIRAANRETQRVDAISFPYTFSLGGLELSAINTTGSFKNDKFINSGKKPTLIGLVLTDHSPNLSSKNVNQLGVENIMLPYSELEKINVPHEKNSEASLQSIAITYKPEEWEQLEGLVKKWSQARSLNVALYNSSVINPNFSPTNEQISELASRIYNSDNPNQTRWLGIQGSILGNQGATPTQELAASLSFMVDYWDRLSDQGISVESLVASTELTLSLSGEFYLDVAKFGAIRLLLYNLLNAYGLDAPNPYQIKIRATSGVLNKSLYDPDANLMRNTVEALAATVGGADIISLFPHDFRYAEPTAFGQRMAVNIQHLLRHEGKLQHVTNPVDGSHFLENAVNQLAEKAWKIFLDIEEGGGYRKSDLVNATKHFHPNIKATEEKLLKQEQVVVGTTRYANSLERITTDQIKLQDQVQTGSAPWEKTRLTTDGLTEAKRPKIAILAPQTNNNAKVSNKITFVTGVITTLGLRVPLPKQSLKLILAEDSPSLLVFCADDAWYQSRLASVATQPELSSVFKIAVGRSPWLYELQQQEVIHEVINAKSDLTAFLEMIYKLLL